MSIASIQQQIAFADVNQVGKVSWSGTNGEASILTNIVELIQQRGVFFLPVLASGSPNIAGMSQLGSADTNLLLVEKKGLYVFDSNGANVLPTSVTAIGGLWQLVSSLYDQYSEIGGAGNTSYTITHNLGSATPTVLVFGYTSFTSTYPMTVIVPDSITINSANVVTLGFGTSTTYNLLIVVKR